MRLAREIGDLYSQGYREGLQVKYYDGFFGIDEKTRQQLMCEDTERGRGYRDGASGKPHRDAPKNLGKRNAAKNDGHSSSMLYIRITPQEKASYVKSAHPGKLSKWVRDTLNKASKPI